LGNNGGILPAAVARPLEKCANGGTECGEHRALKINHKGHQGTQRVQRMLSKNLQTLHPQRLAHAKQSRVETIPSCPLWLEKVYGIDS
jgi:hypothetical protein